MEKLKFYGIPSMPLDVYEVTVEDITQADDYFYIRTDTPDIEVRAGEFLALPQIEQMVCAKKFKFEKTLDQATDWEILKLAQNIEYKGFTNLGIVSIEYENIVSTVGRKARITLFDKTEGSFKVNNYLSSDTVGSSGTKNVLNLKTSKVSFSQRVNLSAGTAGTESTITIKKSIYTENVFEGSFFKVYTNQPNSFGLFDYSVKSYCLAEVFDITETEIKMSYLKTDNNSYNDVFLTFVYDVQGGGFAIDKDFFTVINPKFSENQRITQFEQFGGRTVIAKNEATHTATVSLWLNDEQRLFLASLINQKSAVVTLTTYEGDVYKSFTNCVIEIQENKNLYKLTRVNIVIPYNYLQL